MHVYDACLGLLLGTEAPVMTPNGVDFLFSFFFYFLMHVPCCCFVVIGLNNSDCGLIVHLPGWSKATVAW